MGHPTAALSGHELPSLTQNLYVQMMRNVSDIKNLNKQNVTV